MAMWKIHLKHLLSRSWNVALHAGSSTAISVFLLSLGAIVLGFALTCAYEWNKGGRTMTAFRNTWKQAPPYVCAFLAVVFLWIGLFGWATVKTIYVDHENLVAAAEQARLLRGQGQPKASPPITAQATSEGQPKTTTHIEQKGNGNIANPGTLAAPIKQGDCGVVQNGGSNNIASPNCSPLVRVLTNAQKQGIGEFLKTVPLSVQVSIGGVYGSGDADNYAGEFFPLFAGRHLANQSSPSIRSGFPAAFVGVFVATPTDDDPASAYRNALVDELNSLGITAHKANGSKVPSGNLELLIGFRPEEVRQP